MRGEQIEKIIAVNYANRLSPTAFAGIGRQKKHYGKWASIGDIKKGLSRAKGYTLKKPWDKKPVYNPTFAYRPDELWQMDLLDVSRFSRKNGGTKFLLTGIDCFSRVAFVLPLKSKRGEEVTAVFREHLSQGGRSPQRLGTDEGREFFNSHFQSLLQEYGIKHHPPRTSKHMSIIERFNRTFLNLFSALQESQNDTRYLEFLPSLVRIYNTRHHRSIGRPPLEAQMPEHYAEVLGVTLNNYANRALKAKKALQRRWQRGEREVRVGDTVRVVADQEAMFRKGYRGAYEKELFEVTGINAKLLVPLYTLKRKTGPGEGDALRYSFYREEIQLVSKDITPSTFPKHRVNEIRGDNILLQWTALPKKFATWMPLDLYELWSGQKGKSQTSRGEGDKGKEKEKGGEEREEAAGN